MAGIRLRAMTVFDPYLAHRLLLAAVLAGLVLYDLIGLVVWFRGLPRLARRILILKLLRLRSRALRIELLLIAFLFLVQGYLTVLLFKGV